VQGRVRAIRRPQQRQTVAVRHQPAAGRAEGDVASARQRDPERLPVEATVEQAEVPRVDVREDPILVQGRQVE
jgi:hypothetical protein